MSPVGSLRSEPTGLSWLTLGRDARTASSPGGIVHTFKAAEAMNVGDEAALSDDMTVCHQGTDPAAVIIGRVVGGKRTKFVCASGPEDIGVLAASTGQMVQVLVLGVAWKGNSVLDATLTMIAPGAQAIALPSGRLGTVSSFLANNTLAWNPRDTTTSTINDGVADARAAFVAADALSAVIATAGVYRIASNMTLSSGLTMAPGAVLKPAAGATVIIEGSFSAGLEQCFDLSLGGAVRFAPGATRAAIPQWFGAKGDATGGGGDTDSSLAFQRTSAALPYGGVFHIPAGKYKLTATTQLAPGVTVEGEGCSDGFYGAPPAFATVQTFLWIAAAAVSAFKVVGGGGAQKITNLAISGKFTPDDTPLSDGRIGVEITDTYPSSVWNVCVERVLFYNLTFNVSLIDPLSGTVSGGHPFDWNVSPLVVRECFSLYSLVGMYFDSNNADLWKMDTCTWFVPVGGDAISIRRAGMLYFVNCTIGGASANSNSFLRIMGHGVGSVDQIIVDSCQGESLTHFVLLGDDGNTTKFPLVLRNCVWQLGAEVYLGGHCNFISENNYVGAAIRVDSTNVRVSSKDDRFPIPGVDWSFLSGNARDTFVNLIHGEEPSPAYYPWEFNGGRLVLHSTAVPVSGNWKLGDRVVNSNPAVGQPKAWTCTVAGTPGTWVSEGNL